MEAPREANITEHKTYAGRYYVLTVLSLLSALQNIAWITFSPIVHEAKEWYGLTDIEITLMPGEFILTTLSVFM